MDKSRSNQCQDFDDGSWDLEESEELAKTLENLSSNSWDTSSEDGKRETKVEVFTKDIFLESPTPVSPDRNLVKTVQRRNFIESDRSSSSESIVKSCRIEDIEECLVVEDLEELPRDEVVTHEGMAWESSSSEDCSGIIRRMVCRKSKSDPKIAKTVSLARKSKSFDNLTGEMKFSPKDALIQFEGRKISEKLHLEDIVSLGDVGTHFQEIECRTLITKKDSDEGQERGNAGTSNKEETSSLPDITGTSRSDRTANHEFRKAMSYTTNQTLIHEKMEQNALTESWILLDELGQSQPVTITEVNFLLNGRSADAVLQENKEHFIPKSTVVRNANSDLRVDEWNPLVEESLQHFLNEDPGGEESATKSIRLERKFGNMLLYIQSGINLTSSVRFIPVDTEMIHMWRQSKETMSPISSEDDARVSMSENVTEETSEWDNQETSDDVRCDAHKPGPSVRKRRTRQGKVDECEHRSLENRRIIESLTDEIKQLRMRLEAERCRSSGLEQENHRLRGQLDKCKSGRSSTDSRKTKSETSENKRNENACLPDVSSSSLLSIDEFKDENVEEACLRREDQKSLKESLDRQMDEILKCKSQGRRDSERREDRKIHENSSSISVNTCPTSVVMSETTASTESWFKPKKTNGGQRNISEIINDLEKENERLVVENTNLKKKLNEISLELDEYISSCMAAQSSVEDGRQSESLRNQVCNLKLELENMKRSPTVPVVLEPNTETLQPPPAGLAKNKEQSYKLKDAIVREELAEKSVSLEEWRTSIAAVFREIDESRDRLIEMGLSAPKPPSDATKLTPKNLLTRLRLLITNLTTKIADYEKENTILKRSLQENIVSSSKNAVFGLETSFDVNFMQVPGLLFSNLSKEKSDEYYVLLSEKSTLEEEIKDLRKENDLLLEYQIEHNERLKKATASLREEKNKADSLEKATKLMDIEKNELSQALVSCQKEKAIIESELQMEMTKVAELRVECEKRRSDMKKLEITLEEAMNKCKDLDETFSMKNDIINELKSNCSQLESREALQKDRIQYLTERLSQLEVEKTDIEEELRSTKQMADESSRGMSEYITHLETMVNNAEDNLSEMKEKCNETVKSLTALKKEYDEVQKQNSSNAKMYNKTKDELENCKEIIRDLEENYRKSEEAKRKALCDLSTIVKSEREKTETLEKLLTQRKVLDEELSELKVKAETHAKAKDRFLKEQKDLVNEISILKKEKEKLGQKYRNVKTECNERTKLLRKLDGKLKENVLEYNKRIACLERNVSKIIDKAAAYKDTFMEKRTEVDAMVRELQEQLDTVYTEKKELESDAVNFQEAVKQFQREMNEKKKLSFMEENERAPPEASTSNHKNEELENRLKMTETELAEVKEKNRQLEHGKEDERNKYESIILDLKTQISRYQVRLEVMLKNISTYGKTLQEPQTDTRETEETEKVATLEERIRDLTEELDKKRKRMLELTDVIETNESAMRKKEDECESLKEKVLQLKDEIKNMKNQFSKLQEFLNAVNKNVETYQKERDEVSGKLAKSLKLIVEERASKQSSEAIFAEKEKMFKEQLEQLQGSLAEKKKEYETLLKTMDEKKSIINKLQDDVKKWKSEVGILKAQVMGLKEQRRESEAGDESTENVAKQNISSELKEIRIQNLELRKTEGTLQAKIIRLEDELRGARLLIKELEGDLRSEKTSKKLLKEMITSAKEEIERFKRRGQILASIADKIDRHFNLSEVQSRELFSGYRAPIQ